MAAQLERQNSLVPAWSLNKVDNPSSGFEQTEVVVTVRAMGTPAVKCLQ